MKRFALFAGSLLILLAFVAAVSAGDPAKTMTGEYQWTQGNKTDDLKAVFTARGEGAWDVKFYFDFRNKAHVYTGSAEGSLTNGRLKGEVKNENKRRTFSFEGTVKDGAFHGNHAELDDGDSYSTGTLNLS